MSLNLEQIDWKQIRLVIFDVDGTLYDQSKMRKKMLIELCKFYLLRPWKVNEFFLLKKFREQRDKLAFEENQDISAAQFELRGKAMSSHKVREIVDLWMRKKPLQFIRKLRFEEGVQLFKVLSANGIDVAVLSDFDPTEKINAMGFECAHMYSSESREINVLKPNPKGIQYVLNDLNIKPSQALYIGDRAETDGEASKRAGIQFINVKRSANQIYSSIQEQILDGK